ncbi:DUF262 domain-containing protein, partial [Mycoplasma marinum]
MIKPWKIGTNIDKYYTEFLIFCSKNNPKFIRVEKIKANSYVLVDENGNKSTEVYQETKMMQFIRVICFLGMIELETGPISKVKSLLKPTIQYSVLINKDTQEEGLEKDWQKMIVEKVAKDIRSEFIGEGILEDMPMHKNFVYSIALSLVSTDKKSEDQINLMLENGRVKSFKKFYKIFIEMIEKYDEQLKFDIRRKLLGKIDNFSKIMDSIGNVPVHSKINVERKIDQEIFIEAITLGTFLRKSMSENSKIKIPIYQREYRWAWDTLATLLVDIRNIDIRKIHNIGTIMTIPQKSTERNQGMNEWQKIIDGQQRITSLSIITRAMFDLCVSQEWGVPMMVIELFEEENEGVNVYSDRFIKIKGNKDFDAFQAMITGRHNEEDLRKTKIHENFVNTLMWLSVNIKTSADAEEFWSKLLKGILFTVIMDYESDEYRLFEKMNTGSINLNTMELFKNHLLNKFSSIVDENEEEFQKVFTNEILEKFKKKDTLDEKKIETFILTILRMNDYEINKDTLFEQYKEFIDIKYIDD